MTFVCGKLSDKLDTKDSFSFLEAWFSGGADKDFVYLFIKRSVSGTPPGKKQNYKTNLTKIAKIQPTTSIQPKQRLLEVIKVFVSCIDLLSF